MILRLKKIGISVCLLAGLVLAYILVSNQPLKPEEVAELSAAAEVSFDAHLEARRSGQTELSLTHMKDVLKFDKKRLGKKHLRISAHQSRIADIYKQQGKYSKAKRFYRRSLAVKEKHHKEFLSVGDKTLYHLAEIYEAEGKYVKAESLYIRHYAAERHHSDVQREKHPDKAPFYAMPVRLMKLYEAQEQHDELEVLLIQDIAHIKEIAGDDNMLTALSNERLAKFYRDRGDYSKAEPLYLEALANVERASHPNLRLIAKYLNNLGLFYKRKGEEEKAEIYYLRALTTYEKMNGPDHLTSATTLSNLGGLYKSQDHYDKAEALYVRVVAIRTKAQGETHADTVKSVDRLTQLRQSRDE